MPLEGRSEGRAQRRRWHRWHRGMGGRKLKAIGRNELETQGGEGRAVVAERHKDLYSDTSLAPDTPRRTILQIWAGPTLAYAVRL